MSLDTFLLSLGDRGPGPTTSAVFLGALKKMAEVDTAGVHEGEFAAPLEDVVSLMALMVSNEFKTQIHYSFYANTLRSLAHEGIAEEFEEHAENEEEHAEFLLRRIGVLHPGGVEIPAPEMPEPMSDPDQIVKHMIVIEQLGISLWKKLHGMLGENPTKYTVEQFLQTEQHHLDELWQLVSTTSGNPSKIAAVLRKMMKTAAGGEAREPAAPSQFEKDRDVRVMRDTGRYMSSTAQEPYTGSKTSALFKAVSKYAGDDDKPEPKAKKPETDKKDKGPTRTQDEPMAATEIALMQRASMTEQAMAELKETQQQAKAMENELAQTGMAAQQATEQAAGLEQELMMAQEQHAQTQQQLQETMMQASDAAAQAAEQANAKLRLKMRIDQMRQALATMAAEDPTQDSLTDSEYGAMQQDQAAAGMDPNAQPGAAGAQPGAEPAPAAGGAPGEGGAAKPKSEGKPKAKSESKGKDKPKSDKPKKESAPGGIPASVQSDVQKAMVPQAMG